MNSNTVLSSSRNKVVTITLNRPERLNALNSEMLTTLKTVLEKAHSDKATNVIVLRGAGRAFCSGDDLKEFDAQSNSSAESLEFIESIQDITRQIVFGNKIVIGCIHGWAVGGGLEWAINCDLSVFAENTRCFFPELKWGMFPTGGVTSLLPRMVGLVKAKELFLLGEKFDANTAKDMGLAWKVVSDCDAHKTAHQTAEQISNLPQYSVQALKRVLNQAHCLDLNATMDLETEVTLNGFLDPETKARVNEFA